MSDREGKWTNPEAFEDVCEALDAAVNILHFAFVDGALSPDTVDGLCIDPHGALADMKAALSRALGQ